MGSRINNNEKSMVSTKNNKELEKNIIWISLNGLRKN